MPSAALIEAFETARQRHVAAITALVPLLVEMSFSYVAEVLPGAEVLDVFGQMKEDWAFTLRILRVLDREGRVLFDADTGHEDPVVEDTVDQVGVDYLDVLLDLTGDDYLGHTSARRREA